MKLMIKSYGDIGNLNDERIGMRVLEDCNLKFFAVYHTSVNEKGFYNRPKHVFWFYPKDVKAGDEVVLYTRKGADNTIDKDDHQVHFIYWGLDQSIANKGDCVVLSEIKDWMIEKFQL